jgi:hypothetical protein
MSFLMAKKYCSQFAESTATMIVLQTTALLSRFIPFIKNVLPQFASTLSHLPDAILLVHIWQDLMETDGTPMQCSKTGFL